MSNPFPENDPQHLFWQKIPKNDSAEARLDVAKTVAINEMSQGWKWILEPREEIQEAHERGVEREIGAKPHPSSPNHSLSARQPALRSALEWSWILPESQRQKYVQQKTKEFFEKTDSVENNRADLGNSNWQFRRDIYDMSWEDGSDASQF